MNQRKQYWIKAGAAAGLCLMLTGCGGGGAAVLETYTIGENSAPALDTCLLEEEGGALLTTSPTKEEAEKLQKQRAKAAEEAAKEAAKAAKDAQKAAVKAAKDAVKAAEKAAKKPDDAEAQAAAEEAQAAAEEAAATAQALSADLPAEEVAKEAEKAAKDAQKTAEKAAKAAEKAAKKAAKNPDDAEAQAAAAEAQDAAEKAAAAAQALSADLPADDKAEKDDAPKDADSQDEASADGEAQDEKSDEQAGESEGESGEVVFREAYTYTYENVPAAAMERYAESMKGEGFSVIDMERTPLDELPDFGTETGNIIFAKSGAEEGTLFLLDINWMDGVHTVVVRCPKGSLKKVVPKGAAGGAAGAGAMSLGDTVSFISSMTPAELGLPGESMTDYNVVPIEGNTMVNGQTCRRVNVYKKDDVTGTNDFQGSYMIGGSKVYKHNPDNSVTEIR